MSAIVEWSDLQPEETGPLRIAVAGEGLEAELVQAAQAAALAAMSVEHELVHVNPAVADFDSCIAHLASCGVAAANTSSPFKVHAARVATRFSVARPSLGVANALILKHGVFAQNTEVAAFMKPLEEAEPGKALVMGAGHAARSVALGLLEAGWHIRLWNRNGMKSRLMQSLFSRFGDIELTSDADPSGCKLVVNATTIGTRIGEKTPLLWPRVGAKTMAYDLVIRRVPTEFIREARLRGLPTVEGKDMLVEQAGLALEWFTNGSAPREAMRAAVQERLANS